MPDYDTEIADLKRAEAFATAQGRRQNAEDARRRIAVLRKEQADARKVSDVPDRPVETADKDHSRTETASKVAGRKKAAARKAAKSSD